MGRQDPRFVLAARSRPWPSWFQGQKAPVAQREAVLRGRHPLGFALRDPDHVGPHDETCGSCANLVARQPGARAFWKCVLRETGGAATDVRKRWPACAMYVPRP